jgi:NTE family protein
MKRALVLGGGGVTGVAWELGVLAGLASAGVDLTTADVVVGTSAGSVVAAQVTSGHDLEELYGRQLRAPGDEIAARIPPAMLLRWAWAILRSRDGATVAARIGRLALTARTVPEAERRAVIAGRLPSHGWPDRRLLITAVDALSGGFTVFDHASGVPLVDAVAASCAVPGVWPPVSIDGRRYIDGGIRSAANVDLAAGADGVVCDRIVVLAPTAAGFGPLPSVATQIAALPAATRSVVITPDRDARRAIGRNVLDPARRGGAARAGRAQAATAVASVGQVWSG